MNKASVDRVPPLMKFGYSSADLGANLAYHSTGFYLMFFFTDVFGILPALAGAIFLYSKSGMLYPTRLWAPSPIGRKADGDDSGRTSCSAQSPWD